MTWNVTAQLYETAEKQVQVTNKFASESGGDFTITIV